MRTIIRLRRSGIKNKPQYKLIIQGHYKRLKGRYIEHLGFWFPVKVNEHNRSIILNKARLRYWVSVGAVFSPKVQRLLAFADLAPQPWTSFGKQTLYKRSSEQTTRLSEGVVNFINSQRDTSFEGKIADRIRARDEENLLLRRVKFAKAMSQFVNDKEEIVDDDSVIEDDINTRTEKFLRLKKIYNDIEANDPLMSPLKRELLYRKMNELASSGLLVDGQKKLTADTSDEVIENLYEARNKNALQALTGAVGLFQPITKDEFISVARLNVLGDDFDEIIDDFINSRGNANAPLTKADLHIFCKIHDIEHETDVVTPKHEEELEKSVIVPTRYPLTPLPETDDYDPKDWFDLSDDNTFNIVHNYKGTDKWLDLPLTKARRDLFREVRDKQFRDMMSLNPELMNKIK